MDDESSCSGLKSERSVETLTSSYHHVASLPVCSELRPALRMLMHGGQQQDGDVLQPARQC